MTGSGTQKQIMFWNGFCGEGGIAEYWGEGGFGNFMKYNDPEVFDLVAQSTIEIDPVKHNALLIQATDKVFATYPDIPLGFMTDYEITSVKLHDFKNTYWFQNLVTDFNKRLVGSINISAQKIDWLFWTSSKTTSRIILTTHILSPRSNKSQTLYII